MSWVTRGWSFPLAISARYRQFGNGLLPWARWAGKNSVGVPGRGLSRNIRLIELSASFWSYIEGRLDVESGPLGGRGIRRGVGIIRPDRDVPTGRRMKRA